jgi:hypothetical protein
MVTPAKRDQFECFFMQNICLSGESRSVDYGVIRISAFENIRNII